MFKLSTLSALLLCLPLASGCLYYDEFWDTDDDISYGTNELNVTEADMSGDLGTVTDFSGQADIEESYAYPGYTYIEAHAVGRGWWTMTGINLDVDLQDLEVGGIYEANVLGCSGPRRNDFDYDGYADRATVEVYEGDAPGSIELVYHAEWDDAGPTTQTIDGSMTVLR